MMPARILFLCAQGSRRALLAASILHAQGAAQWEVWSTPPSEEHGKSLVEQVLQEQGIALLPADRDGNVVYSGPLIVERQRRRPLLFSAVQKSVMLTCSTVTTAL